MTIDSFTASVALSSRARRKAFMGVDHIINGLVAKDRKVHAEFSLEKIILGRKLAKYEHAVYYMNHN